MMLVFFLFLFNLSEGVFLTMVLLESILILLPLAFLAVLIFLEELGMVESFYFLLDEVLISSRIDLGE